MVAFVLPNFLSQLQFPPVSFLPCPSTSSFKCPCNQCVKIGEGSSPTEEIPWQFTTCRYMPGTQVATSCSSSQKRAKRCGPARCFSDDPGYSNCFGT